MQKSSRTTSIRHEEKQQDCESVEKTFISSRSRRTCSIEAEAHKRSTSMSPTASELRTKPKTAKIKETKDFSNSETEMVDVMDTFQHAISTIEKETAKNPTFLQKEIDTGNTNSIRAAVIRRKTSMSIAFSKQCK